MATVASIAASHAAESLRLVHWVPGVAALSVAFLTIATADRREDRQLEHEQIFRHSL